MAEKTETAEELSILEAQDGSATVDLPENMLEMTDGGEAEASEGGNISTETVQDEDADAPGDDEELRQAKRNRRRAKKELIRKTNQEKDAMLTALRRETEQMRQEIAQLKRNTKAEQITRIDKGIEDAQVRLEYAKMKLAEATQNQDGQAMVEAQTLWQNAQEEVRNLSVLRQRADAELKAPQQQNPLPDPSVQRLAAAWMRKNPWYNPSATDADSRVAKKMDELMATQGWNPSDPDYWDELDARLQKELPHRYTDNTDDDNRGVRRPRNVVGSSGREVSAAYGGSNRTQFVLSPERVKAMKDAGAWDNPERKQRMIKQFIAYDRANRTRN
jgi:hypothetical protein